MYQIFKIGQIFNILFLIFYKFYPIFKAFPNILPNFQNAHKSSIFLPKANEQTCRLLMSRPISKWTSQVYDTGYNQGFHQLGFQVSQRLVSSRTQQTLPTGPKKCRPLQQLPLTFLCTWKKKFLPSPPPHINSTPPPYLINKSDTIKTLFTIDHYLSNLSFHQGELFPVFS